MDEAKAREHLARAIDKSREIWIKENPPEDEEDFCPPTAAELFDPEDYISSSWPWDGTDESRREYPSLDLSSIPDGTWVFHFNERIGGNYAGEYLVFPDGRVFDVECEEFMEV